MKLFSITYHIVLFSIILSPVHSENTGDFTVKFKGVTLVAGQHFIGIMDITVSYTTSTNCNNNKWEKRYVKGRTINQTGRKRKLKTDRETTGQRQFITSVRDKSSKRTQIIKLS